MSKIFYNSPFWMVDFLIKLIKIFIMRSGFIKSLLLCLFILVLGSAVNAQQNGNNTDVIIPYAFPDVYYPVGKIIKLEKLDINKANLEQLMTLPEINEDLALKIMRRRPVKTLQDLVRLPYIDMDRMKIILKGISNLVVQPDSPQEDLKQ